MILEELKESVVHYRTEEATKLTQKALQELKDPLKILNESLVPAMEIVGEKFVNQEYFLPELLVAAQAMSMAMEILKPHLLKNKVTRSIAKIAVGTVQGDLHDIGKNIVKMMFESANFEVIDLGKDVPTENFFLAVEKEQVQFLAISALLTTTMLKMQEILAGLEQKGLRNRVTVLVGGAPVTKNMLKK